MRRLRRTLVACALVLASGSASPASGQNLLTGAFGALAGTGTGGYITLSLIVARAQTGHYLHDFDELFGWTSTPVLIGAVTGTTVGLFEPDRLWTGFILGAAGTAAGAGIGWLIGTQRSNHPEGKWAGAAIGAGAGMALGSIIGTLFPQPQLIPKIIPKQLRQEAVIPITIRIPVQD